MKNLNDNNIAALCNAILHNTPKQNALFDVISILAQVDSIFLDEDDRDIAHDYITQQILGDHNE